MAIDFPNSPSNNDIYTVNGKRWIYSNGKWSIYGSTAPDATASDTEPTGVGDGHIWYRSDQSQTLIRYDNTWVEVGSAGGFDSSSTSFPTSIDSATGFAAVEAIETALLDGAPLHIDDANERVGVGNVSPSHKLDVTGDINATGAFRVNGTPQGTWVDFSGSLTLTNWTLGNGTIIICKYAQIGKVVHYIGDIILGSTSTTSGGDLRVNLPVTASLGYAQQSGLAKYFDIGTALHAGMCMLENQTTLNMMVLDATTTKVHLQNVNGSNPFAWSGANNDRFIWQITYQAA